MVIEASVVGSGADAKVAARLFHGLSDTTRLRILLALTEGERSTSDLVAAVGTSQPNVWKHVNCLSDCGLVTSRSEGRQSLHSIATPDVLSLLESAESLLAGVGAAVALCPNLDRGRTHG